MLDIHSPSEAVGFNVLFVSPELADLSRVDGFKLVLCIQHANSMIDNKI